MKLRIGIKGTGWLPNLGIFVVPVNSKALGDDIIEQFENLKALVRLGVSAEFANRLVCEWRN